MAGNIYGYQGVHTPLESVTQGRYTLADYTSMRTELTGRLIALENQGGFVPTNVEITGYLHMLPGGAGMGEIETTSSITGASLYINAEAHCGNLVCDNTAVFGGNVTVNGGSIISGNGSGLTNIDDISKLPKAGGAMTGPITSSSSIAAVSFSGNGASLTGVVATDSTKLPLTGGTLSGTLAMGANAITSTGAISAGTFSGNGAAITGVIAAGLTGSILFTAPACAQNYKQNQFANWNTPSYTPFQLNPSVHDCFRYTGSTSTNLLLTNNGCSGPVFYQDGMRLITVLRPMNGVALYSISIFPPTGYLIYYPGVDAAASYLLSAPTSSVTFMVISAAALGEANGQMHLISIT